MPPSASEAHLLRTLGLLTRGALHELSNPLVALVGSAELALQEAEPGSKLQQRIALTHRTGSEIAAIVRALQAFIRRQSLPPAPLSMGAAAAEAIALVELVLPTHDVTLAAAGDARVVMAPGELQCALVELLVEALAGAGSRGAVTLTVRSEAGDAVVEATGGGELRVPAAEAVA